MPKFYRCTWHVFFFSICNPPLLNTKIEEGVLYIIEQHNEIGRKTVRAQAMVLERLLASILLQ